MPKPRPRPDLDTQAYRKARAAFLAEHPRCAYCGAKATTVDHIVEVDQGIDPTDQIS